MIDGHGDDAYKYGQKIRINFSSNVYNHVNHNGLREHLYHRMESIRSYPEPEPYSLEQALAHSLHLSDGKEVCVTNGATEAIYLIAQTFRGNNSAILIWICNPNNPTGSVLDKDVLKAFIEKHTECCFVIDQSYEFFTLKPLLSAREAAGYPNVILLHSMTKRFAVPGLRLGFMTANQILLREIRLQRMPWSVNQLAIEAGHYLLRHAGEYHVDISLLLKEKDRLAEALLAIGGMEVWASDTHYMLVQLRMGRAAALKEYLAGECGILIRDASNFEGLNEHFFRIATQTPEENDKLVESIKKWTYMY